MLNLEQCLGYNIPIFAFSHCRDVVVEVTKAGGFGVLGAVHHSPEQLEMELNWIDQHVGGKPYGIDVLMTTNYDKSAESGNEDSLVDRIPVEYKDFVTELLDREGVPRLAADLERELLDARSERDRNATRMGATRQIDVALAHPLVKLVVSALGVPSSEVIERLHAQHVVVGGMVGKPEHAHYHCDAGVDLVIAQGCEAAGHTGSISTMVLVPQVADICHARNVTVLAAGGISTGRHIAAANALGADGVWIGSLWLGSMESELLPYEKEALFRATSSDTVQSKCMSGKQARMLRSKFSEAWSEPGAPTPLPAPFQAALYRWAYDRIARSGRTDLFSGPAGQGVGEIVREESTRDIMYRLQEEYGEALDQQRLQLESFF